MKDAVQLAWEMYPEDTPTQTALRAVIIEAIRKDRAQRDIKNLPASIQEDLRGVESAHTVEVSWQLFDDMGFAFGARQWDTLTRKEAEGMFRGIGEVSL